MAIRNLNQTHRSGAVVRRMHHGCSAQSVAVSLASRAIVKNVVRAWALAPDLRWPYASIDRLAGLMRHPPTSARIERVRLGNCGAEWIDATQRMTEHTSKRAILYLHGGAFLTCGLNTHRSLARRLSVAADAGVLNVDYRTLPSHHISDAIDDALSGLRWLRRRGYPDDGIVVAGDSAGGYLAFTTTLAAIRTRLVRPAGVATISPFTDADPAAKLAHRNADRGAMFPREALAVFARYLDRERIVSPVDADLSPLPPVVIHASTDEVLLPDAETMAQRLSAAGVRCELHLWDHQVHAFPVAADVLPEGRRAIRDIGEFVKEVTAAPYGPYAAA